MRSWLIAFAPFVIGCNNYSASDNDAVLNALTDPMVQLAEKTAASASRIASNKAPRPEGLKTDFYQDFSIDQAVPCPDGGSAAAVGSITVSFDDQTGVGTVIGGLTMTMTDCTVGRIVVEGAPDLTFTANIDLPGGAFQFDWGGAYSVVNGPTCNVNLSFTSSSGWSGQWCGFDIH